MGLGDRHGRVGEDLGHEAAEPLVERVGGRRVERSGSRQLLDDQRPRLGALV
jgi:hypothetical protein